VVIWGAFIYLTQKQQVCGARRTKNRAHNFP